ncbi:hypothetical protein IW261DRAFT_1571006 [Armillaria novae-zelandiae]|uniref:Uncharacterized protein n=1 Tax=Armillaria novae-zelandiae TaxID=153914 RepID=A0AA39U1N5_9AGAR|nr:hypothetical protein IW261DRAFT_1571006 [Armillaria novae-zelandiae]
MARSEHSVDPPNIVDDSVCSMSMGPTAFQKSLAHSKYYAGLDSLSRLQGTLPQSSWTSAHVDKWVRDAEGFWTHCRAQIDTAGIAAKEFRGWIAGAIVEYNELIARVHQYNIRVFPLPMPEASFVDPPHTSTPRTTPAAAPLSAAVSVSLAHDIPAPNTMAATLFAITTLEPLTIPAIIRPTEFNLHGPRLPAAFPGSAFSLDPTSPLYPAAANTMVSLPSVSSFTDSIAAPRLNPLLGARRPLNQVSRNQSAPPARPVSLPQLSAPSVPAFPDPGPVIEGSSNSSYRRRTPLFFPGTDDEDELPIPAADMKGKGKEVIPGTDKDEEELAVSASPSATMAVDEDDNGSLPPTRIAWRFRSPVAASGSPPITVSEVRPRLSIHQADPNSVLFKLLGAPSTDKPKKCSRRKPKFNNPLPPPKTLAGEGVVRAKRATKKVAKTKGIEEIPKGGAVHPHGPSRLRAPPAAMGVQLGGFSEEVPTDYMVVRDGVKTISVLVVSRDFGDFVEVDEALWNKKVAPFVGEQYVKPCDQCHCKKTQCRKFLTNSVICVCCHYAKLPCLVNGMKALNPLEHYRPQSYESINAFESSMDTLSQHTSALEDLVLNYMAGLDAMSHLQGLHSQIG